MIIHKVIMIKMHEIADEQDLNKGGLFDNRLGAINIWCSPEDHPDDEFWNKIKITKGALKYPREFIASIYFEPVDESLKKWKIKVEVTNYAKIEYANTLYRLGKIDGKEYDRMVEEARKGTDEEWKWVREKITWLINEAKKRGWYVWSYECPVCGKEIKILNEFFECLERHGYKVLGYVASSEYLGAITDKGIIEPKKVKKIVRWKE